MRFYIAALAVYLLCIATCMKIQASDCDLRATNVERDLKPAEGCLYGIVSWLYPSGEITLTFPRSLFPKGSRKGKVKACLKLQTAGHMTVKQQKGEEMVDLPLNSDEWACSKKGRTVTLILEAGESPLVYMEVIEYKVEKP